MLSRSAFGIRRLISQRKPRDDDEESFGACEIEEEIIANLKGARKEPRSQTWAHRKHLTSFSLPKSKTEVGFVNHFRSRTPSPLPPRPNGTPHSSASSLCSCEYHVDTPSSRTPAPGSKSPSLYTPRPNRDDASSPASSQLAARPPSPSHSSTDTTAGDAQASTLKLFKALSRELDGPENLLPCLSKPVRKSLDNKSTESLSSDLHPLIRETDKAFQAVCSALAEAKLASQSFPDSAASVSSITTPPQSPLGRQHSKAPRPLPSQAPAFPKRSTSRRAPHLVTSFTTPTRVQPDALSPTSSRPKRKEELRRNKGKTKKAFSLANSRKTPLSLSSNGKHGSRWTLTDNVTDLFSVASSKLFSSRIEADEMLTPSQIQELKLVRLSQLNKSKENTASVNTEATAIAASTTAKPKTKTETTVHTNKASDTTSNSSASVPAASESTSSGSTRACDNQRPESISSSIYSVDSSGSNAETPVDSFHLFDLPSRIRAFDVSLVAPSPVRPLSVEAFRVEDNGDVVRRDLYIDNEPGSQAFEKSSETDLTPEGTPKAEGEDYMVFNALSFPSPPLKNPARYLPKKGMPLATIEEAEDVITTSKADPGSAAKDVEPAQQEPVGKDFSTVEEDSTFLLLQSTPYSVNTPGFRHGPIKFDKSEVKRNLKLLAISNRSSLHADEPRFTEDTLDWTAFQMAILGGAGEVFWNPKIDDEDEEEAQERKDLEELEQEILDFWVKIGHGQTGGRLVSEEDEIEAEFFSSEDENCSFDPWQDHHGEVEYSPVSLGEPPEVCQEPEMEERGCGLMPVMPETPALASGKYRVGYFDPEKYYASVGLTRRSGEAHPKRYTPIGGDRYSVPFKRSAALQRADRQMSLDTMPPSPMMEIRVTESEDGERTIGVPMGYNLGHDLSDYLKWEAEHIYASGGCGSD